jgi:hypothetical protein
MFCNPLSLRMTAHCLPLRRGVKNAGSEYPQAVIYITSVMLYQRDLIFGFLEALA